MNTISIPIVNRALHKKLLKFFKRCYLYILNCIGELFIAFGIFRIYINRNNGSFVILYHYPNVMLLSSHINFFKKYFNIINLNMMLNRIGRKGTLNDLCITFDDGYRYIYTTLFPILRRENVPFAVFISVKNIENNEPFWWDIYDFKKKKYRFKYQGDLKNIRDSDRMGILQLKEGDRSSDYLKNRSPLQWRDIKEMLHSGLLSIGDHGYSHTSFTLLNEEEKKIELLLSKKLIKERLGINVTEFAYPNGDFTLDMENVLRDNGYRAAFTTLPKENRISTNRYFMHRIEADTSGVGILALKLMGLYYPLTGYKLEHYLLKRGVPVKEIKGGKA